MRPPPPPPLLRPHTDSGVWVWLQDTVEEGVKGARFSWYVMRVVAESSLWAQPTNRRLIP